MTNLNILAVSSGGGASLGQISTIAAGGDGQAAAGVPNITPAQLVGWGSMTTIADTIKQTQMVSLDQIDSQNAEDWTPGASGLTGYYFKLTNLPFVSAARQIKIAQNTGANNVLGFTMDVVGNGSSTSFNSLAIPAQVSFEVTGSADTAITWNANQAATPGTSLRAGTYALLGAKVSALTNYGLIRFGHASFAGARPGFLVTDTTNTTLANAVAQKDIMVSIPEGYQFVALSQLLQTPLVPTFTVTANGSGLTFDMLTITTDTPRVEIFLSKIG